MKHSGWLLLLTLILTVACGGSGGSSNAKRKVKLTEEQIAHILGNQFFECAAIDGGACPTGIARLLILDKEDADNSSVCSGFMVDQDTLITNQHCISSQLVCNNTYVAIYNGSTYEQNKCKSIVKIMNDYANPNDPRKKLDVAVVKLEGKYFGSSFKAAAEKPMLYDEVTAWVIDHTGFDRKEPNPYESRVTEIRCRVSADQSSQSLLLDFCPVIDGNSGSPLLDSRGDVVGVIWGGSASEVSSSLDLAKRRELAKRAAATEVIYFSGYMN